MFTPMAANYANFFMDMFETLLNDLHQKAGKKLLMWLHLIDDMFLSGQMVNTC